MIRSAFIELLYYFGIDYLQRKETIYSLLMLLDVTDKKAIEITLLLYEVYLPLSNDFAVTYIICL